MKRLLFTAFAVLFACTVSQAQMTERYGGGGSFNFGIQTMDVEPLNDIISQYGYEELSTANISFGGGGQFYLGKWVVSGEGGFVGQDEVTNDAYTLRFGSGYGMFSVGYNVVDRKQFLLYPSVGGGFYGTGISLSGRIDNKEFEDIFAEPQENQDVSVSAGAFTGAGQIALNADWLLESNEESAYGLLVGLSAGYRFAGTANFENIAGSELANSPDFNPGGAFLTLRVGGGFRGPKGARQ